METTDELLPLDGMQVILADHSPPARSTLRDLISRLGAASVSHAGSAAEVLQQVKLRAPELIISDHQLDGERDGQQLLEELRQTRMIGYDTMFVMITGERSYQRVLAVAEFAPDDYLIKPFSAAQLFLRISAVVRKKRIFSPLHELIHAGKPEDALAASLQIRARHPEYGADALRQAVEIQIAQAHHLEAEAMLREAGSSGAAPWTGMSLARIRQAEGAPGDAVSILTGVIAQHPDYLGAKDLLAQIYEQQQKPAEALAVLEQGGAAARNNVSRLRHAADLAVQSGDHRKAATLYESLIARARNSALARTGDYVGLAASYVETGRHDQAGRVALLQQRAMKDAPGCELAGKMIDFQRCNSDRKLSGQERARAALDTLVDSYHENPDLLTPALEFDLLNACYQSGRAYDLAGIAQHLLARASLGERTREKVEAMLQQIEKEEGRSQPRSQPRSGPHGNPGSEAAGEPVIPLDQTLLQLTRLLTKGWDEPKGNACRASVVHWTTATPAAAMLPVAQELLYEVLVKYGMDANQRESNSQNATA